MTGNFQIVGDENKGEAVAALQLLDKLDDVLLMSVSLSSSRSLVGSSASSRRGELISARAMATRRCSPPDILSG